MTDPILEQIALALVAVIEGITVEAGYNSTVSSVTRPARMEEHAPQHLEVALFQNDPDEDGELEGDGSRKSWVQPFGLAVFFSVSDADATPLDTLMNRMRADLEKAVRVDPTLGGLATDLRVRAPTSWVFTPNRAFEGLTVNIDVHYRTQEDNPYSQ